MKHFLKFAACISSMTVGACQSTSNLAQIAFTPDHFSAPQLTKDPLLPVKSDKSPASKSANKTKDIEQAAPAAVSGPILVYQNGSVAFLNRKNPLVKKFLGSDPSLKDSEFAQVAYNYLMVADAQCARRQADISQSIAANKNGFGMFTLASSLIGSALSNANAANAASASAAFFTGLGGASSSLQTQINSLYSDNIVASIDYARLNTNEDLSFKSRKGILEEIQDLMNISDESDIHSGHQAKIRFYLNEYNGLCTIQKAQRLIDEKLARPDPVVEPSTADTEGPTMISVSNGVFSTQLTMEQWKKLETMLNTVAVASPPVAPPLAPGDEIEGAGEAMAETEPAAEANSAIS